MRPMGLREIPLLPMTCATCLMEHDQEIHAATRRVRHWLPNRLNLAMRPVDISNKAKVSMLPDAEYPVVKRRAKIAK